MIPSLLVSFFLGILQVVLGRQWNDTKKGTIIFEEAWTIPALAVQSGKGAPPAGETAANLKADLLDIHNQRLARMDANGVDYMVLSCAQPCVQGISDPDAAASMAQSINDQLAASITNNTLRFGGFASLAMHNATVAAQEVKRAVVELGFLGATYAQRLSSARSSLIYIEPDLIFVAEQAGSDNATFLYYDQPEYDEFWSTVTELDVPVYFHPRTNPAELQTLLYGHAPWLKGPGQEFADTLSTHIMGLMTNGVSTDFPH